MRSAQEIIRRSIEIVTTWAQESVCAWCRYEYDNATGERIRRLTDEDYKRVQSHGICKPCKHEILSR